MGTERTRNTPPPPPDFELGRIWTDQGWLPYEYAERVAICMESGMSKQEAEAVAKKDWRRRQGR